MYKSTDAGASWSAVAAYDTTGLPGAVPAPNLLGWADGGLSGFMPDEGGQGTYDLTLIVDPDDPDMLFTGGVNMWGSDDGGLSWDIVSMWIRMFGNSIHADQHSSSWQPQTGKLFQSHDGGFNITSEPIIGDFNYVYTNCIDWMAVMAGDYDNAIIPDCYEIPTEWESIAGGIHNTEYYRLGCCRSHADMVIGGTQDNGTYLYKDGEWVNTLGGDGMECMIHHTNPDIIFATNYNGALSRSDDGGLTYTSSLDTVITQGAGESGDWVTPFVMHPHGGDTIFAAFENVWKSGDLGVTWTKLGDLPSGSSLRVLEVSRANPDYIYTSRSGAIYRTKDGGQNWDNITSGLSLGVSKITGITTDFDDPEKVWISVSGFQDGIKAYMSADAGNTWANISENLPNVSMNAIVFQGGTINGVTGALYIGSDIGVFYTNDSIQGTTSPWIMYSDGLPNVIINELEIHYGAQKLRAATYGRGLWETDLYSESVIEDITEPAGSTIEVNIFPNPNKGVFTISATMIEANDISIDIFAITGENIISLTEKADKNYSKQVNISSLASGTYLVQIEINNCHYTKRVVKE